MFLSEREGVWPIPFATGRSGFCLSFLFISLVSLFFLEYIHFCSSFFFFFWTASLLRYTYIRETGHIEILYSLVVAIYMAPAVGRDIWDFGNGKRETGFYLFIYWVGNGVYGWDCTQAVDRSGISLFSTIQATVLNTFR